MWKLFLPLYHLVLRSGEHVFLFSQYEYDAWVGKRFDEIGGANSISKIVAKQLLNNKYLKQFAYGHADVFNAHACSRKLPLIESLAKEFAETVNKPDLIYDFDENKNSTLNLNSFYQLFGKQTILQLAERHFLHENDMMTPTMRKIYDTIYLEALSTGIDKPTIKTLMCALELHTE